MEIGVKPGSVFTSMHFTPPERSTKKSTRERPEQPSALNARTAYSCTVRAVCSSTRAGTMRAAESSRYFAW